MAVAVVTATIGAGALAWTHPAAAQTGVRLTGSAGWSGRCHPGRPVLVRARIAADRLVSGVLSAQSANPPGPVTEVAVEVAGGTEEEVALVVSQQFGCGQVTLKLREGSITTTAEASSSEAGGTVLLGLLPGARATGTMPTSATARTGSAAVAALEPELLDQTGAVAGLDSIGTTAADLEGLSADQRQTLITWVANGGTLIVDADRPQELDRLPEAWRPPPGAMVPAGKGLVRQSGTALRDGKLDGLAEPSAATSESMSGFGMDMGSGDVQSVLRRRSGVRVLSLPVILGALILYVLLVGPGIRIGLRRMGRLQLTWLVVPVAALTFSGLAVAGGDVLRRGGKPTHISMLETDAAGSKARTAMGVPTRTKNAVTANLPAGWLPGGQSFNPELDSSTIQVRSNGQRLSKPGIPGGFVTLAAAGPAATEGRLVVDLGTDSGQATVRNEMSVPLEDVAVFTPGGVVSVGRIEAGATAPFTVPAGANFIDFRSMAQQVWFDEGESLASPQGFWALTNLETHETGLHLAAGWTDRLPAPMALRSGRPAGTTLVVGRASTGLTGVRVGSSFAGVATTRFVVPPGPTYTLEWDGARFGMPALAGGRFGPDGVSVEALHGNRWVPLRDGRTLPAEATADGVVYVRSPMFQPMLPTLVAR